MLLKHKNKQAGDTDVKRKNKNKEKRKTQKLSTVQELYLINQFFKAFSCNISTKNMLSF